MEEITWELFERQVEACRLCPLCQQIRHKVPGQGDRNSPLMLIGEGPGQTEDEEGLAFVGAAGQLLTRMLEAIQLPRERVYICNVVKCRPPHNRVPTPEEAEACRIHLRMQTWLIRPKVVDGAERRLDDADLSSVRPAAGREQEAGSLGGHEEPESETDGAEALPGYLRKRRRIMSYISVRNLEKRFVIREKRQEGALLRGKKTVRALQGVSFDVERGELLGYIGPNGAGKSTTVKILSGILTPDGGDVTVGGRVPWKERREHVRHIGVVFGQRTQLWWDVPIRDSYDLLKDIYRIPAGDYRTRLAELTEALQLGDLLRTPLRQLSLVQRMRAELCGSLLHRPELLFLDEPTIGLDAVSKLALREFLQWENRQQGTTILLTTHDMEDIVALCSRVMVLGHGRKLFDGALSDLLGKYDTLRTVTVNYEEPEAVPELPASIPLARDGKNLMISYSPQEYATAELIARLQAAGTVRELTVQPQNIDRLVAAMYREMDL